MQMAVLGGDALGMELHAVHRQRPVRSPMISRSSVSAVTSRSRGQAVALDDQRMIARRLERRVDAVEDALRPCG